MHAPIAEKKRSSLLRDTWQHESLCSMGHTASLVLDDTVYRLRTRSLSAPSSPALSVLTCHASRSIATEIEVD